MRDVVVVQVVPDEDAKQLPKLDVLPGSAYGVPYNETLDVADVYVSVGLFALLLEFLPELCLFYSHSINSYDLACQLRKLPRCYFFDSHVEYVG